MVWLWERLLHEIEIRWQLALPGSLSVGYRNITIEIFWYVLRQGVFEQTACSTSADIVDWPAIRINYSLPQFSSATPIPATIKFVFVPCVCQVGTFSEFLMFSREYLQTFYARFKTKFYEFYEPNRVISKFSSRRREGEIWISRTETEAIYYTINARATLPLCL